MRCISDPFDYVLFDGLSVDRHVKQIAFIEVKCGRGRLSSVQRSVRDVNVVRNGRVHTEVWEIGDPAFPSRKSYQMTRLVSYCHRNERRIIPGVSVALCGKADFQLDKPRGRIR